MDDRLEAAYRVDAAWAWVLGRDGWPDNESIRQAAIMCGVEVWVVEHLLRLKDDQRHSKAQVL